MSIHRRAAKRDDAEAEVIRAFEEGGATVQQLSGEGVPDLLIGLRGMNLLVEVKTGNAKLKPCQAEWHRNWRGTKVEVVRNAAQARKVLTTACIDLARLLTSVGDPIQDQADGVREEDA